jgi:hexosaminidase
LSEVIELFPSKFIHIGGDEAPKVRWEKCGLCQARIKKEKLKDEHELQSYFIRRIEKFLNSKGRQIIGWDEILEGGLAPNAAVMSWRGNIGGIAAAKQKHKVVMSPTTNCYFDHYQTEDRENEPLAIGGYLPLEKVYEFNPVPPELSNEEGEFIIGAQGNVWTEYITTPQHVE